MQKELWKDVLGYEEYYQVSNSGNVKSLDRYVKSKGGSLKMLKGKIKIQRLSHDGYPKVRLSKNKIADDLFIHRLVAIAFVPAVENKKYVNHKNGIRTDNNVENLEWCTMSENILHGFRSNGRVNPNKGKTGNQSPRSIPIIAINRTTGEETKFESGNLAAQTLKLDWSSVHKALNGRYKYSGNYYFKYS